MEYESFGWNVIIRGAWNRAILTPNWIATNLFGVPKGTPVSVYVPVDMLAPSRVQHEDLIVIIGEGFFEVKTDKPILEVLHKAKELGIKALNELPKTPVLAAGFNLHYELKDSSAEIADLFNTPLDDSLVKADYSFKNRQIIKGCVSNDAVLKDGTINVYITADESSQKIQFNFSRKSQDYKELIEWLEIPINKVESEVEQFMVILGMKQ